MGGGGERQGKQSGDECEAKENIVGRQRKEQLRHKQLKGITILVGENRSMQLQDHFIFVRECRMESGYLAGTGTGYLLHVTL